ncbi:hypothetical protein AGMMS49587_19790 [Spirochaetia bacterium]|nr:hypothetical protein AGMMS49587_19790 [Spirochaetia bacterium]
MKKNMALGIIVTLLLFGPGGFLYAQADAAEYYVTADGQSYGPYGLDTLREMAEEGTLTEKTSVWKAGMPAWVRSEAVPEIAALIVSVPQEYYVAVDDQSYGPYGLDILRELVEEGTLTEKTWVWKAGMPAWVYPETVSEITALLLRTEQMAAAAQHPELTLYQNDLRLEKASAYGADNKFISGYNLFVRKKPDMESVLLTEPTGAHALRATEWNSVNGYEIRYVDGKPAADKDVLYSIISSTPLPDKEFGSAFKLFLPDVMVYGITNVITQNGLNINLRAFSSKYSDNLTGNFQDNVFPIRVGDAPPPPASPNRSGAYDDGGDYQREFPAPAALKTPAPPMRNFHQAGQVTRQLETPGLGIAHPSLPMGLQVRVTNPQNGRSVIAAVVGRIPASTDRIADLSGDTATDIGMGDSNGLPVILDIVDNR